jgi:hypothetical protein
MMDREQLKREIDLIDESQIEVLSRIIWALTHSDIEAKSWGRSNSVNPLKDSILFEDDLISPIETSWDAEQ